LADASTTRGRLRGKVREHESFVRSTFTFVWRHVEFPAHAVGKKSLPALRKNDHLLKQLERGACVSPESA